MTLSEADRSEIIELTSRYANAMDSGDHEEWLDTWADDGVWQGGLGTIRICRYNAHAGE